MLRSRGLPPLRTVVPFPVALAVRLCADETSRLAKFDQSVILRVAVDARDVAALRFAKFHGVVVVALLVVELETPAANIGPAISAFAFHCGGSVSAVEGTFTRNFSRHHHTANTSVIDRVSECACVYA